MPTLVEKKPISVTYNSDGNPTTFVEFEDTVSNRHVVPLIHGGTGADSASGARTNLGLGTLATLSSVGASNLASDIDATDIGFIAAKAAQLETSRTIHGVSFDGSANIDLSEAIQDTVGAMFTGNTETNISVTYQDSDGTIDLVATDTSLTTEEVQDIVGAQIVTNGTHSGISFTYDDSTDGGVNATISGVTNDMLSGSIANSKLANSSVTINSNSLSLGGTLTLDTDDIDDSSATNKYFTNTLARAAFSEGTGVTITSGEIAIGQEVGTSSDVEFNDVTVAGDLTVSGTTTTVSSTNTEISDKLIELANGATGTPSGDAGIVIERGTADNAFIGFDESADKFIVGTGTFTGSSTGNLTITTGTIVANLEGTVPETSVTAHQAALSITESQISDLQTYLTAETNDLSSSVTWANVPDANITESSVTQHEAALSITESQITDLQSYLTSETSHADVVVDGDFTSQGIMLRGASAGTYSILTDNSANWNTAYGWGDHSTEGYLTSFTETNDLSSAVTWANVPDANITATSVRQHISGGDGIDFTSGSISVDATVITSQTAETSIADDDVILIYDTSATALKKMTKANFVSGLGGGGMANFTVTGDSGTDQTVADGNTLDIAGGTGIDTVVGATDTLTVSIDSTVATLTGSQTLTNKTLTSPVLNTGVSGTAVKDEDNMSSDSATHLATQQSIKAYVDTSTGASLITGQTAETSIADDDVILIYDTSATALRKMTKANFVTGLSGGSASSLTDADSDTKVEVERTTDDDTVYVKAGGTDVITATSSGVTITNLTVTGTSTQANEMKITDTLIELNADGTSLGVDAGIVIERGTTGNDAAFIWDESDDSFSVGTFSPDGVILFTKADGVSQPLPISSDEITFNHADGTADNLPISSNALAFTEADGTVDNIGTVTPGPETDISLIMSGATLKAKTQTAGDDSTAVATTAFVKQAGKSVTDGDSDTKIEVEATTDVDEIKITTGGTERMIIDENATMSAGGGFFLHRTTLASGETFTISADTGTLAAGPLDIQGTVDIQGSLVVL